MSASVSMLRRKWFYACVPGCIALLAACGGSESPAPSVDTAEHAHDAHHDHDHDHDGHHHHHEAPHGGTLIELGDHVAHLEAVLDPESGLLTLYVLDGEAEHPIRVPETLLELTLEAPALDGAVALMLDPVESVLTGETAGDTSQFSVENAMLVGLERFTGRISAITVRGQEFREVKFSFPEGNE